MTCPITRSIVALLLALGSTLLATATSRATLAAQAPRYHEQDSVVIACVDTAKNALIFPGTFKYIDNFHNKLEKLLRTHKGNLTVWHVGGSHVQADILSHRLRIHFATLAGKTGTRGMLFPFAMARTNYGRDHRLSYTGTWTTERNIPADASLPLGITGITAATTDTVATIALNLDNGYSPRWTMDALRLVCESDAHPDSLWITLTDDRGREWAMEPDLDGSGYIVDRLPRMSRCTIIIDNPTHAQFMLRGIEPLNSDEGTINYYSSGINGASTLSWLRCDRLDSDLMNLKPDLVVLGIGINDAAMPANKFEPDNFKSRYRRILDKVRRANPNAMLLLLSNNDSYYKGRPNVNAVQVRDTMVELAREYGGCVWDCYGVMGGMGSSSSWRDAGLMARDRIHFSRRGYELLGDLIFEALITDFIDNDE